MQSRHIGSLVLLLVGLAAQLAWADKLTIGSPAPAIDIEHWFHDKEPITAFKAGKVYVVEFWATWCGPCLASMPHLAEIQDRHSGDLTVISVSDEDPETVEKFLDREKGDTTFRAITAAYSLTTDPDQSVNKDYMKAAGQNGIPTAFIVGKTGEIEWIGHPMRIDEPVAKVIAGEWDRAAYAAELEEETTVRGRIQVLSRLVQQQKFAEALAVIEEILADVKTPRIRERVEELRQDGSHEDRRLGIARIHEEAPDDHGARACPAGHGDGWHFAGPCPPLLDAQPAQVSHTEPADDFESGARGTEQCAHACGDDAQLEDDTDLQSDHGPGAAREAVLKPRGHGGHRTRTRGQGDRPGGSEEGEPGVSRHWVVRCGQVSSWTGVCRQLQLRVVAISIPGGWHASIAMQSPRVHQSPIGRLIRPRRPVCRSTT